MKEIIEVVSFNTDTIRIGAGLRTNIIEIETDHGHCVETSTYEIERCKGLIIKKIMDGRIVLGVQDENGD
jgi:DNA polymerase III sliding clamp (beta) subunit (PCNA family)